MKLVGNHVYIRFLQESDANALLDLHVRNRDFFQHYLPLRDDSYFTLESQLSIIQQANEKRKQDQAYSFGIFLKETNELIGNVALTEVLRAPFLLSCYIGYYLDQKHNGKGYMTEAVTLAVKFAFDELKLHRIEAGVMPHNIRSIRVLEKAGFQKEGIARKSVKINGKWEDHQILAIINENE
ncbi:GNAT family N-acetyltransferase [Thermoflavimicrobium dichotomicum]|uniref:Ribosomal-protein-alanine N-acetyltransferase n=1 Tax=Thermoflavimicrobium dichotomicum TaxID=46223 RepID=A0A1I3TPP6_9BACL|nr:GNAT family protein [Thermoflavimicrobium dichotomicum]SFJ71527.1 ribosomal-protein-alanine N-acetyltransferase [Thermoflavimicrobium dichotomicum]